MAQRHLVRDLCDIGTDVEDWPSGLPVTEREVLARAVLDVLREGKPLGTHDLYQRLEMHPDVIANAPTFKKAAVFDWLYGCVVRAARAADCEQRWHAPPKGAAP
jgi:hypothetical protein